jgi:hypothetical protein
LKRAATECLRSRRDLGGVRADPHKELADQIDSHAVFGYQRAFMLAAYFDPYDVHIDGGDLVEHRDHKSAAIHHDFLAEKAGADKRRLFRRASIEPSQDIDGDDDDDGENDEPQEEVPQVLRAHNCNPPKSETVS